MVSVVLLGYGNVGQHLHWALQDAAGVSVQQIYSRSYIETLNTPQTQNISTIEDKYVDAEKIAILDGVLYIEGNHKMYKYLKDNPHHKIISALLLRDFLYQL